MKKKSINKPTKSGGNNDSSMRKSSTGSGASNSKGRDKEDDKKNVGPYTDRGLQFLIASLLIAPYLGYFLIVGNDNFLGAFNRAISEIHSSDMRVFPMNSDDLTKLIYVVCYLSTPHIFYYILWTRPYIWKSFCKKLRLGKPVKAFSTAAHIIKLQQAISFYFWYADAIGFVAPSNIVDIVNPIFNYFISMSPIRLILGIELILLGQLFNGGVYQTIGEAGVYYGIKFGESVPWVFGFPFSVLSHPQYRGATISIWGFIILLATESTISKGIYAIGGMISLFYYISGYVEEFM